MAIPIFPNLPERLPRGNEDGRVLEFLKQVEAVPDARAFHMVSEAAQGPSCKG